MSKRFYLLFKENDVELSFVKDNHLIPIAYLCDHCDKKELEHYVKALNNYSKVLDFVKELADESVYEKYENENEISWAASLLLQDIGETE